MCGNYSREETIQGRKLFKGGNYMRKCGIWIYLNLSKPIWSHPNLFELIWTYPQLLNLSEPIWTYLNLSKLIWTNLNLFKPIQTYLKLSKPIQTNPNLSEPIWNYPNLSIINISSKNKRLLDFRQVSRVDELTDSLMSGITSCLSWLAATIRFARQQQNATRFLLSNCFPATRHSGLQGATLFIKLYCLFFYSKSLN